MMHSEVQVVYVVTFPLVWRIDPLVFRKIFANLLDICWSTVASLGL